MDYTLSNSYDTHAGTGNRMHEDSKAVPTAVSDLDMNSIIWSLMEVVKAGGLAGIQFDKSNPASYRRFLQSIQALIAGRFTGSNQLVAASGYQLMPGADEARLILQWGSVLSNASGVATVTFPIAFNFGVFILVGTHFGGDTAMVVELGGNRTKTGTKLLIRAIDGGTSIWSMSWFAIGV